MEDLRKNKAVRISPFERVMDLKQTLPIGLIGYIKIEGINQIGIIDIFHEKEAEDILDSVNTALNNQQEVFFYTEKNFNPEWVVRLIINGKEIRVPRKD